MFRAGSSKHAAYPNRGRGMREYPFIQINPRDYLNFLVVDVDKDDAELWLLHPSVPEPHWVITNPDNGHAQAGWMIEPVYRGPGARPHPLRYAAEVQRALDALAGNDQAFTRFLVRNPVAHSPAGDVRYGSRLAPYRLGELMRHMKDYRDAFDPEFSAWPAASDFGLVRTKALFDPENGRNNTLFSATRGELWRRYETTGVLPGNEAAVDFATALNASLPEPLPGREVRELAASAVRQVARGKGRGTGAGNRWLAMMGRRGGQTVSERKKAAAAGNARKGTAARQATADENVSVAARLRALGRSIREIAESLKRSVRTIHRYLANTSEPGDISQPTGSPAVAEGSEKASEEGQPLPSPTACTTAESGSGSARILSDQHARPGVRLDEHHPPPLSQ